MFNILNTTKFQNYSKRLVEVSKVKVKSCFSFTVEVSKYQVKVSVRVRVASPDLRTLAITF